MILARAPLSALEVVLEVRVAGADLDDARERRLAERRPAEVRVHDHAGRVEHATERRRTQARQLGGGSIDERDPDPSRP